LAAALVGTALARAELDRGAPGARLESLLLAHLKRVRPYGVGNWEAAAARWARWAERWSAAELSQALRLALGADRALKSTTLTDERGLVEQLVLTLAVLPQQVAA
jgi:DNA polymerase III delta subunit